MKSQALPLKEYQVEGLDYVLKNPYAILGLDPGLGKTRIIIEAREKLKKKCLVVSPSYLIPNWVNEIRRWGRPNTRILPVQQGKKITDKIDTDFIVTSYDLAQKAPHFFEWADMVALDEGHNIKSQKAKRTQFIHRHVYENSIERLIIATGTPIKNRVEEFYSLLAICNYDPKIESSDFLHRFPTSIDFADYFSHRREYSIQVGYKMVKIVKWEGIRRISELKKYLENHYIRIKSQFKEPQYLDVEIIDYNTNDDLDLLRAFREHFGEDESGSVDPTAKARAALLKADFTVQYAKNLLEQVESVVIFTDHVEACKTIADGLNVIPCTGQLSVEKRAQAVQDFQDGKTKAIVATIPSLSTGVTLTKANHMILNDYPWVPGDLTQTIGRINRLGQDKSCFIHRILGSPQDRYIIETLEKKRSVIEQAT